MKCVSYTGYIVCVVSLYLFELNTEEAAALPVVRSYRQSQKHFVPSNTTSRIIFLLNHPSAPFMASQPPPEAKSLAVFSDGISALSYLPAKPSHVVASSWDGTVRIHDTSTLQADASATSSSSAAAAVLTQSMEAGPLLSLATPAASHLGSFIVAGGMDGSVKLLDYATGTTTLLGRHKSSSGGSSSSEPGSSANACSCLASLSVPTPTDGGAVGNDEYSNLICSASWNRQFCLWDIRASSSQPPIATLELPGKAFSMDVDAAHHRVIVATSGRRNVVIDLKQPGGKPEIVLDRESSLKFQTRTVRFFPDGRGMALGSVEGRVGVEFFDELPGLPVHSMKRYAFKCHRVNDTVYPVNCITFHPRFTHTFATGGCDGSVVLWDGGNKKKLTTFPSFPTSISAIAFNHDGSEMAIASSYTFEDGDREHPQDELFVRKILDSECLPKPKD